MRVLPALDAFDYAHPTPDAATMGARLAALRATVADLGESPEIDVASAAAIDVGGQSASRLRITGAVTIAGFGANYRGAVLLRFAAAPTLTHSATLQCPGNVNYAAQAGDLLMAYPKATAGVSDGWIVIVISRNSVSHIVLQNYLTGGVVTGAGTTLTIQPAQAADSTNVAYIGASSVFTKTGVALSAGWSVGSGGGMLDAGTSLVANTLYYAYAIQRPDTGLNDYVVSTNSTTPTLSGSLAPYTRFRRLPYIVKTGTSGTFVFVLDVSTTPALQLLSTQTFSAAATVDVAAPFFSLFEEYLIQFGELRMSIAGSNLRARVSTDNGSTFIATATYGNGLTVVDSAPATALAGSAGDTSIQLSGGITATAAESYPGTVEFKNPAAAIRRGFISRFAGNTGAAISNTSAGGVQTSTTQVNALRFLPSAGTMTGSLSIYGVRK